VQPVIRSSSISEVVEGSKRKNWKLTAELKPIEQIDTTTRFDTIVLKNQLSFFHPSFLKYVCAWWRMKA
jgi:hypothetical protein